MSAPYEQRLRPMYDATAREYEAYATHVQGYYDAVRAFLRRNAAPGKRLLDVGCGPGHLADGFPGVSVTGIDLSAGMIAVANEQRPWGRWLCRSFHEDLSDLGRFDLVLMAGCFEFCLALQPVVKRLARATAPGGRVLLAVTERVEGGPGAGDGSYRVRGATDETTIHLFSRRQLQEAVRRTSLAWRSDQRVCGWWTKPVGGVAIPYLVVELEQPAR